MEKNCAFQYAKNRFMGSEMVCDKSELTLDEAKALWNEYYPDLAKHINGGMTGEMVIWINMANAHSYGETLQHISTDAESNGVDIWETRRTYFTREFKTKEPA
jgi:hypothetical protein